ncbi:MAG: hypothetical protein ACR2KZ_05215 [Segetibacter sp.]
MLKKEKLLASIKAMPEEEFEDIEVLLERIVMLQKIGQAEKDLAKGKIYSTPEAKEKLVRWLK